jgi:hypothetical protein
MDNKHKAAELVMEFLPIVGQDPYTGIDVAKKCAKVVTKLLMKAQQQEDVYDYDEIVKHIDTF